jgi:hypothetical protein
LSRIAAEILRGRFDVGDPILPLTLEEATTHAVHLRDLDLSYRAIAHIMRAYHAQDAHENTWRSRCRRAGAAPKYHGTTAHLAQYRHPNPTRQENPSCR